MKKIHTHTILIIFSLIIFLSSCSNALMTDPRLYNKKPNSNNQPSATEEPEIEAPEGFSPFDLTNEWYNKPDCNGDEKEPEKQGFLNTEFDTMSITGWFSQQNVPTYTMKQQDVWGSCTNETSNQFTHTNAPNTEGQGWKINGVTYFLYKGKNPAYAGDGSYNTIYQKTANGNPLLSRFYFYRFTGKGGGVQWLDNFLIAVDTYSKLVFAFAEPTEFNKMGAPTRWEALDRNKVNGAIYPFYMYDPVGYIVKNPDKTYTVQLYKWFQDNLAAGVYQGQMSPEGSLASKNTEGAGRSPFISEVKPADVPFLEKVKNKTFAARENYLRSDKSPINPDWENNGQGYGENLIEYKFTNDGKKVTIVTTPWEGTPIKVEASTDADMSVLNNVKYKKGNTEFEISIDNEGNILTIENIKYFKNFKDNGPAFKFRARGKEFSARKADGYKGTDGHGYGMHLFTYKFDKTADTVTVITSIWNKGSTETKPLQITSESPLTVSVANSQTLSINNASNIITSDVGNNYFSNFKDKGPSFLNRVRDNPNYAGDAEYKFINGGYKLIVDGVTYDYQYEGDNHHRAIYRTTKSQALKFYGVELIDQTVDGKPKRSNAIQMTSRFAEDSIYWGSLGWLATKTEKVVGEDLPSKLGNSTFSYRDYTDGQGEILYSYIFSPDRKVIKTKTPWKQNRETIEEGIYKSDNIYTINEQSIEFDYDSINETITVNGKLYHKYFDDMGPALTLKVRNQKYSFRELAGYEGNDGQGYGLNLYTYSFTSDGTQLTLKTTPWNGEDGSSETQTITVDTKTPSKATATFTFGTVNLALDSSEKILSIGTNKAYRDFNDKGPSFHNRLGLNPQYSHKYKNWLGFNKENKYIFAENNKKLTMNGEEYIYYSDNENRNRSIYKQGNSYFGVELIDQTVDGKLKRSNAIKMTTGYLDSNIGWLTLGWEAYKIK